MDLLLFVSYCESIYRPTLSIRCKYTQEKTVSDRKGLRYNQYSDVIMGAMASQITSLTIVYSTVYSGVDQRKHQSPASLAFVWGIHRSQMFSFDDVIVVFMRFFGYDRFSSASQMFAEERVDKFGAWMRWLIDGFLEILHDSENCLLICLMDSSAWSNSEICLK